MRPLSASQLLTLWETGLSQPPLLRALSLLRTVYPDTPLETLATLPIGERDSRLLTLRAITFGPQLNSLARCPKCRERLELTFDVDNIRTEAKCDHETLNLSVENYDVTFRLPNTLDLIALTDHHRPDSRGLLERCLFTATHAGTPCPVRELPEAVVQAIAEKMSTADPQAEVLLALTCPTCQQEWQATFDILSYFWMEIHAWAQRILREVHLLAARYGWSETYILALTPLRRAMYLQMIT
ncbi:MAG: hypothetical protein Fur0022_08800 [Anaerolineales bacterium]